ncbi:MAG: hypothetical protein ACQETA_09580, partial [Bacteroidota bacterium]
MRYLRFLLIPFLFCLVTNTVFAQTAEAGADQEICGSLSTTLAADDPDPYSGVWSVINGPGTIGFDDNTKFNAVITADTYGEYTLQWTVDGPVSDEVIINFYALPTVSITGSTSICVGSTTT